MVKAGPKWIARKISREKTPPGAAGTTPTNLTKPPGISRETVTAASPGDADHPLCNSCAEDWMFGNRYPQPAMWLVNGCKEPTRGTGESQGMPGPPEIIRQQSPRRTSHRKPSLQINRSIDYPPPSSNLHPQEMAGSSPIILRFHAPRNSGNGPLCPHLSMRARPPHPANFGEVIATFAKPRAAARPRFLPVARSPHESPDPSGPILPRASPFY